MAQGKAVKLSQHNVEKRLRENSSRASIVPAGERRRSECCKKFGLPKVDEVVYDEFATCFECKTVISTHLSKEMLN